MWPFSSAEPTTLPPPSIPPDPIKPALKPTETQTLTLPSNRTLGYATYGSTLPSSPAIFLFHGLPGSRIVGRGWDTLCKSLGVRLIAIDRPGCGLSSYSASRCLIDWPSDVLALADHLGIREFGVVGASGGGPFALACARFLPAERLRRTVVVCGVGPLHAVLATMPVVSWRLLGGVSEWMVQQAAMRFVLPGMIAPYVTTDPARLKRVLEDQCATPEEKAQIQENENTDQCLDNAVVQYLEAFRQGSDGALLDGKILCEEWGFDVGDVDGERVWMVHGDQDNKAPLGAAQWVDEKLGGGRLKVLKGKTHFTIWRDHSEEVFRRAAGLYGEDQVEDGWVGW